MAVNKVVYGNDTLIDLTEDTVQPEDVALGETFHDRSGALRTGTSSGTGGVPIELLEDTVGWTGKNLLSKYRTTWNTSGQEVSDKNGVSSAKIPVTVGQQFRGSKKVALALTMNMVARQYDSNGDFVSSATILSYSELNNIYTVPSGISYIAVVQFSEADGGTKEWADTNEVMLMDASISDTSYEPYHEDVDTCKANNSALAPVIDQDTAPRNIAQGEPFMHYGDFCIAKTDIASGATFIKDSNYTVGTVGDSLGLEVLTLDITNAATEQGITFDSTRKTAIRWGHIVSVGLRFTVANTITLSSQLNLCNAFPLYDSSWLPYLIITDRSSPYGVKNFSGFVSANGSFMLPATTIEAGNYDIRGTYICS